MRAVNEILQRTDKWTLHPYLKTTFQIRGPALSPNGQWLAYASNDTNKYEIYVQRFPEPTGKYQISTGGGTEPLWSKTGTELFYRSGNKMTAVSMDTKRNVPQMGTPSVLFEGAFAGVSNDAWYDVNADGTRFLMLSRRCLGARYIVIVQDWMNGIKALAPAGK